MPAMILLPLLAALSGNVAALPASLHDGALAACAPTRLTDAEECLHKSLSAEDYAILLERTAAHRFRPFLDCAMIEAWHLEDSTSAMGAAMDKLLGFHHPMFAAGMILSDLQSRAAGQPLPFELIRDQLKASAPPQDTITCPSLRTTSAQEKPDAN